MSPISLDRLLPALVVAWMTVSSLLAAEAKPAEPPPPPLQVADTFHLAIPKNAFGREYLLSASLIPQAQAPTSTGLAGKIVRFELFPDGVDLYESTKGLVVTEDLPAKRLLASFPIVRQDVDKVVIDFNKGMRRVFTKIWYGSSGLDLEARDRSFEVPEARVLDARVQGDQVIIRQNLQLRDRQEDQNVEARFEVRYFLAPYQPGEIRGREQTPPETRWARFFETEGQLEPVTGRVSSRMVRFDLREPVVFYYSANTPDAYVEAVKEGILYWNRVFGREIIQAKAAPPGVTAPDSKHNVIQWVPWENAGFAYADVLLDPLNGESLHGQAYITSVFAFSGKARARALLRAMQDLAEPKKDEKKGSLTSRLGVPCLAAAPGCQLDPQRFAAEFARGLADVLASESLTDEAVQRASQDYVREVVAHEVGHILGLRHNFAGSLATSLTQKELDDWFQDYVAGKELTAYTNKVATSSMMEYSVFKAAVFMGWQVRTTKDPLPHDRTAIQWGYFDGKEGAEKRMLFATDPDTGVFGDVRTFDFGPEPVVTGYAEIAGSIDRLPHTIIERYIAARAPVNPLDRVPLDQVVLNPRGYAAAIADAFAQQLRWFRADLRSRRVENAFDFIGELNELERHQAHWKALNEQIDKLGGLDRAYFSCLPVDLKLDLKKEPVGVPAVPKLSATNLTATLEKLLNSPAYTNFVGLDEKRYSFTKEEKELIVKRAGKLFEKLEAELVSQTLQRLENAPRDLGQEATGALAEDDATAKLEQRIIELAKLVITTKDESKRIKGKVDKSFVEVVDFKYEPEVRLAAAKALNEKTGSFKNWSTEAKGELNTQLKNDVEAALNISHFKDFRPSILSRPLHQWYQQQQDILQLLPAVAPAAK